MKKFFNITNCILLVLAYTFSFSSVRAQSNCDLISALSKLQSIKLTPNYLNEFDFEIDKDANMPTMSFSANLVGLNTDEQNCVLANSQNDFSWKLHMEYWDGDQIGVNLIGPNVLGAQRKGPLTGDSWDYSENNSAASLNITTQKLGSRYGGGVGTVDVTLNVNNKSFTDERILRINESNETSKSTFQKALGDLSNQVLAYKETKFRQVAGDTPILNCANTDCSLSDGGFGLMQITDCPGTTGTLTKIATKTDKLKHGLPTYLQIWNWKENIKAGESCFNIKLSQQCSQYAKNSDDYYRCGYKAYNGSSTYGDSSINIMNEIEKGNFRKGWF